MSRAGSPPGAVEPSATAPSTTNLTAPALDDARTKQPADVAQIDTVAFLASYWGDEWPRVETELRKQEGWADYDLSKLPMPPPLEVAMPKLREQVTEWTPGQRDAIMNHYLEIGSGSGRLEDKQWIQSKYAQKKILSEADFTAIAAHVGPSQGVLEESAGRIIDAILDARIRLFDQGERVIAPFSTLGTKNPRDMKPGLLNSKGFGWEGWAAGVMVLESDVPGYEEMRAENLELIRERNRALKEIIASF